MNEQYERQRRDEALATAWDLYEKAVSGARKQFEETAATAGIALDEAVKATWDAWVAKIW